VRVLFIHIPPAGAANAVPLKPYVGSYLDPKRSEHY